MQTALVFRAVEVSSSQANNGSVVAPEKVEHDSVKDVDQRNQSPKPLARAHVPGSDLHEEAVVVLVSGTVFLSLPETSAGSVARHQVCWDEHRATNGTQNDKDITQHVSHTHEHGSIQADFVHEILLFCFCDWRNPVEDTLADLWRRMFTVGVLSARRVDDAVVWSEQAKGEGGQ